MADFSPASVDTAETLLRRCRAVGAKHVYFLGNHHRRVTIYDQQKRAFNLVWALVSTGRLKPNDQLAVVGAGVGGITAAAAAADREIKVELFEGKDRILSVFENSPRYLHPRILDWPDWIPKTAREGTDPDRTALPYLNWVAGQAKGPKGVHAQLDKGWNDIQRIAGGAIKLRIKLEISRADEEPNLTLFNANGTPVQTGKPSQVFQPASVIIATGFGNEKHTNNRWYKRYWSPDELEYWPTVDRPLHILVSGLGDGGLIDLLRAVVMDFRQGDLAELFDSDTMAKLGPALKEAEAEAVRRATGGANENEVAHYLYQSYVACQKYTTNESVNAWLERCNNVDRKVSLNGPLNYPYTLRSSILPRFATFLLQNAEKFRYRRGQIDVTKIQLLDGTYRVAIDNGTVESFDQVILRHGPDRAKSPSLGFLLPSTPQEDQWREQLWPEDFFRQKIAPSTPLPERTPETVPVTPTPHPRPVKPSPVDQAALAELVQMMAPVRHFLNKLRRTAERVIFKNHYDGLYPSLISQTQERNPSLTCTGMMLFALTEVRNRLAAKVCQAMLDATAEAGENRCWLAEDRGAGHLLPNAQGLFAALRSSPLSWCQLQTVADWLLSQQNADGGWSRRKDLSSETRPLYTAFALNALIEYFRVRHLLVKDFKPEEKLLAGIRDGVAYLVRKEKLGAGNLAAPLLWLAGDEGDPNKACLASTTMSLQVLIRLKEFSTQLLSLSRDLVAPDWDLEGLTNRIQASRKILVGIFGQPDFLNRLTVQLPAPLAQYHAVPWPQIKERGPEYSFDYFTPIASVTLLALDRFVEAGKEASFETANVMTGVVHWILEHGLEVDFNGERLRAVSTGTTNEIGVWPVAHSIVVLNRWLRLAGEQIEQYPLRSI